MDIGQLLGNASNILGKADSLVNNSVKKLSNDILMPIVDETNTKYLIDQTKYTFKIIDYSTGILVAISVLLIIILIAFCFIYIDNPVLATKGTVAIGVITAVLMSGILVGIGSLYGVRTLSDNLLLNEENGLFSVGFPNLRNKLQGI